MKKIYFDTDSYGNEPLRLINKFRVVDITGYWALGERSYCLDSCTIEHYLKMFKEQIYLVCKDYQFDPTEIEKAINAVKSPDELIELHNDNHTFTFSENICLEKQYADYLFR